jgi:hypothetical protein
MVSGRKQPAGGEEELEGPSLDHQVKDVADPTFAQDDVFSYNFQDGVHLEGEGGGRDGGWGRSKDE